MFWAACHHPGQNTQLGCLGKKMMNEVHIRLGLESNQQKKQRRKGGRVLWLIAWYAEVPKFSPRDLQLNRTSQLVMGKTSV